MSVALDSVRAGRLAELDPELPGLAEALQRGLTRSDWHVHDVRWTPGQRCRLAFAVGVGDAPATFVAVDVTPEGWEEFDYRADPALRGLTDATDPARVVQLMAPLVGGHPEACEVEPVRYRPGSRCVLRYRLQGAEPHEVFAKALPRRARVLAEAWRALAGAGDRGPALVPAFLGEWHDHDVLLAAPVSGPTASSVLGAATMPARDRAQVALRLGALLARLHGRGDVEAPSRTADDQLATLGALIPVARHVDTATAARLAAVVDALDELRPEPGPAVLAHGGFRAGQSVVSASGALVLLDLDGLHHGDAARDLATALAHFTWQELKHPALRPAMREAADAFLAGYEQHAGSLPAESLAWWRAAALVQLVGRRYRRLELADWPLLPVVVDRAEALVRARAGRAVQPARPVPLLDSVRSALQDVAALPDGVAVEMTEVLGAPNARRAVHQYVVRGLDGPNPVTVIAKSFDEAGRAELVHEHLRILSAGAFTDASLRVPAPVALVPDRHLVLFRGDGGTPLDRIEPLDEAREGVRLAARWLARLHRSAVMLPRRLELDREVATTAQWAVVIGEHHPELLDRARALADSWIGAVDPREAAWAPIHKDFHAGHVLVGEGVCVIDLDEARMGAAALDVVHFVAYLELGRSSGEAAALGKTFVAEYAAAGGWALGPTAGYAAYTWLKIAKQWATGRVHGRDADHRRRLEGVDDALTRGLACLGE